MAFRMSGMRSLSVDVRAGLRIEQRLAGLRGLAWAGLFLALCGLFAVVMVALAWRASPERPVLQLTAFFGRLRRRFG